MERRGRKARGPLRPASFPFFLFLLCLFGCQQQPGVLAASRAVTYGSAIALVHDNSGHKLYSGKIAWGSGSIGQAVTAQPAPVGSAPSLWLVRPAGAPRGPSAFDPEDSKAPAAFSSVGAAGTPVKCGSRVMFEHVGSQAVLRAGQGEAPLSNNNEVGAASGSEGPEAQFTVDCVGGGEMWRTGAQVKLKNALLDANLQASKQHAFSYSNCGRGCPIAGHLEVSVARGKPSAWSWQQQTTDVWTAQPQLLFHVEGETEDADEGHDEL
ncbi:hypothetical protein Efla_004674 [Eimeria flavescens]